MTKTRTIASAVHAVRGDPTVCDGVRARTFAAFRESGLNRWEGQVWWAAGWAMRGVYDSFSDVHAVAMVVV